MDCKLLHALAPAGLSHWALTSTSYLLFLSHSDTLCNLIKSLINMGVSFNFQSAKYRHNQLIFVPTISWTGITLTPDFNITV